MQDKQKAIVFGGAGFIGSHVCDELSNRGYVVTIFDVKHSPYLRADQQMIIGDMLDEKTVNDAVKGVDYIFNFAGALQISGVILTRTEVVLRTSTMIPTSTLFVAVRPTV